MFSFNLFADSLRPFNTTYRCYSVSMLPGNERRDVERGGKIIMPPSALDHLTRLNIVYPMLFKLTNQAKNRITHCGVLEFVADEGKVYLPYWMMRNLLLDEGSIIKIESTSLPVATYSKFQPQSVDFLDITNPKAVLENALRNFACLSTDDVIAITYNDKVYEVCVLETKPGPAVTIIECDMNVEFAPPVGYQEPNEHLKDSFHDFHNTHSGGSDEDDLDDDADDFEAFSGEGQRVDGKKHIKVVKQTKTYKRGIPDYGYEIGTIKFIRVNKNRKDVNDGNNINDGPNSNNNNNGNGKTTKPFQAFHGTGQQLIKKK